jgi:hypothetical protein
METTKIFDFKGLYQNGNKKNPPLGFFRRLTNAYKDRTGRIRPYGRGVQAANVAGTDPLLAVLYKGDIFQLLRDGTQKYGSDAITQVFNSTGTMGEMDLLESTTYFPADNFTSAVVNNKLFFCEYVNKAEYNNSGLGLATFTYAVFNPMRFDGINVQRAGLPTPWFYSTPTAGGNARLRAVYLTIGLDAEPVFSNYLEWGVTVGAGPAYTNAATMNFGGYTGGGAVALGDAVGAAGCYFPTSRQPGDSLYDFTVPGVFGTVPNFYNRKWARWNGLGQTYTGGVGINFTATALSPGLKVGDWLLHIPDDTFSLTPANTVYDAYYFRVSSLVGMSVTLAPQCKGLNGYTSTWEDIDLDQGPPKGVSTMASLMSSMSHGLTNIWTVISKSANAGGTLPYIVCSISPIYWDSEFTEATYTTAAKTFRRNVLGIISSDMSDWYDITRVKTTFPPVIGITAFNNLLVGFDRNAVYFTDITLGGSTEMVSGFSNILPYGSEYGDIVAVCGCEDFLFLSRERRNYVIRGELTTGNISITECDLPVLGAANARAVSNAFAGKIIFMNKSGVWSVSSSGQITELSAPIRDLFLGESVDGNPFDASVFKTKAQRLADAFDGGVFQFVLEPSRGLIFLLTGLRDATSKNIDDSTILVHDANDGSWYEWDSSFATAIEVKEGALWCFAEDNLYTEDGVLRAGEQQLIIPQWLTQGAPSLEKQFLQVKFFGSFPTSAVKVSQQNNWQAIDGVSVDDYQTYEDYTATSTDKYDHKQRLDTSKAKASSIGLDCSTGGGVHLEGIEVEWDPCQQGIKG